MLLIPLIWPHIEGAGKRDIIMSKGATKLLSYLQKRKREGRERREKRKCEENPVPELEPQINS